MFEVLYGKDAMRFNVHMLLYAVQSVKMSAPLWTTSAFPFESNIYLLKRLVNGKALKGIEQQIVKKSLRILSYDVGICNSSAPNIVKDYCKELFLKGRTTENVTVIDGIAFLSKTRKSNSDQNFVKCIYKKQIYETRNYS